MIFERIFSLEITSWGLTGHFGRNKTIEAMKHHFIGQA